MPIKGVIFDHDGTLVDSERCHFSIWHDILINYGHTLDEEEYIQKFSGVPTSVNAQYVIENYTLSCSFANLLAEKLEKTADFFNTQSATLMPYAEECLKTCQHSGLKLAIATGASHDMVKKGIGRSDCFKLFESIATSDRVARNKPAPEVYQLAIEEIGLETGQIVAVEDSPTGIAAAKAAGLTCIAVENTYSQKQDLSQADFQATSLREASKKIQELAQTP